MTLTQPLKWHGGKHYLAKQIIDLMPDRCKNPNSPASGDYGWLHYVEPYFGGGSVLLAMDPEGISQVVNDINGELSNFWKCLQGESSFQQLIRLAEATPFSEKEFILSQQDNVEYRAIPEFPGYRAGTDGSIWSCWKRKGNGWRYGTEAEIGTEWRELSPYRSDRGYLRYTLVNNGEKRLVGGHILVLEAFRGPRPDGCEACHNDGDPSNNSYHNLRWDTHSENEKDKAKHRSESWKAWKFFVKCRQSLAGRMQGFASLSRNRTRRAMNEQVSSWLTAIEGLPEIHKRLQRVVILNKPAIDVIQQQDGPRTLFYCDPPYVHESRATTSEYGEHEMTVKDHAELLNAMAGIEGRFLLSGYHSELYDDFARTRRWRCVEIQIDNKASSKKSKDIKTECVWMNY